MDSEPPDFEELRKRLRERPDRPAPSRRSPADDESVAEPPFAGVDELKPKPIDAIPVDRTRWPTRTRPPPEPPRPPRPPPDSGGGRRASSILLALGAVCIALFATLQVTSGGGRPSPSAPVAAPTSTAPQPPNPTTGSNPNPPAPAPQASVRWTHDVQFPLNTPYSFGSYPLTRTESFGHGLEVNKSSAGTQLVADGNGDIVSPWRGRRAPSATDCANNSPSSDRVQLGGSGVPIGGWICAQSGGDVLRLKYQSGSASLITSSYRFLVTVWNH